jgi:hypothetical protein
MRSAGEIFFRLRQELGNLYLAALPPKIDLEAAFPFPSFPCPEQIRLRLQGTSLASKIGALAQQILSRRFPLLGTVVETGESIHWRRDYLNGIETAPLYLRRIPYLDVKRAGDHKLIWELNRHQHLVLLAQEFLLRPDEALLNEIQRQFESWQRGNPYQRGINWTSALEVAFRAISWIWILHFAGEQMPDSCRRAIVAELYRHGRHLEYNLSVYFSPNTHLLGEAVALHALGVLFPQFPRSRQWVQRAGHIVEQQIERQIRADGSHFEQSSYYQIYAVDMVLFHRLLAPASEAHRLKIQAMAEYLSAIHSPSGVLPLIGDDDGGRFFFPYGDRRRFGRATLATCSVVLNRPELMLDPADLEEQASWWLPDLPKPPVPAPRAEPVSILFPQAGLARLRSGDIQVLFDVGPFGFGSAGHSHSDALNVIVEAAGEEILADAGTYTYVGDPIWRNRFRGTAAHNTVRVAGVDQASIDGPFRWTQMANVTLEHWSSTRTRDLVEGICEYSGFRHRRRCLFRKPHLLWILDEIDGPPGSHKIERFWHPGVGTRMLSPLEFLIGSRSVLVLSEDAALLEGAEFGWRSQALGEKHPTPVIVTSVVKPLPCRMAAVIDFSGEWEIAPRREERLFLKQLHFAAGSTG